MGDLTSLGEYRKSDKKYKKKKPAILQKFAFKKGLILVDNVNSISPILRKSTQEKARSKT